MNMDDFMMDSQGRYVPASKVAEVDKLRDAVVREIVAEATGLSEELRGFRDTAMEAVTSFVEQSAAEHGVEWGGKKGNIKLTSYDGTLQVSVSVQERIVFNEKLKVAKEILDRFLMEEIRGVSDNIRALVLSAFDVDQEGKLNTRNILALRKIKIGDQRWSEAMNAISEAVQIAGSKEYIRVYTRPDSRSKWEMVNLNIASV